MDFIKISSRYIKIYEKPTAQTRFKFELEETIVNDSTEYLVRVSSTSEFAKFSKDRGIVQFCQLEMIYLEKEFAEFFVQTCMEFETIN